MADPADRALLERLRQAAERLPGVDLVVLYGSRAGGSVHAGSDVDLAVRLGDRPPGFERRVETELARASSVPVDVVFLNEAPPQLRFEVARAGVLLFERTAGLWVRERARAMVDWWDWAPLARRIHHTAVSRLRKDTGTW